MRKLILLGLFVFLAGCASDLTRYWEATCTKDGWTPGTPEHGGCVDQHHAHYIQGAMPAMGMMMQRQMPAAPRQCYTSGSGHTTCY
jgi:hypothetical protein